MKHMNANFNMTSVWSVIRTFLPERDYSLAHCFREYKLVFDKFVRVHGTARALKIMKEISLSGRKVVMKYGINTSFKKEVFNNHKSCCKFGDHDLRTYSDGFPRCLAKVRRLLTSRKRLLNLCGVSILQAYLFIRTTPEVSFKEMTSPFTGKSEVGPKSLSGFISTFTEPWLRKEFRRITLDVKYDPVLFPGFKSGSYGAPSIAFAHEDARTILQDNYKDYLDSLLVMRSHFTARDKDDLLNEIKAMSGNDLLYLGKEPGIIPNELIGIFPSKKEKQPRRLGRTCFLADRGGKTRVITSCSYLIQAALAPLHKVFMELLRTIRQDYTFRQDHARSTILRWHREGRLIYSYDLSAATDRFPIAIQYEVLKSLYPDLADSWLKLMRIPIEYGNNERVFEVGQPMGLLSSWPVFTLTHHLMVRYCALMEGFNPHKFSLYCVLGDDVVIAHRATAKRYKTLMTKWFGVRISSMKSFRPRRNTPMCTEFAKRNYVNGEEVTPLAPDMLAMARSENPLLLVTIMERILLNWKIKLKTPDSFIRMLFLRVLTSNTVRVGVTRYMFHPLRINPYLYRIKGVREHVDKIYPPFKRFNRLKQDDIDDTFSIFHYMTATRVVRYNELCKHLGELKSSVNDKYIVGLAYSSEQAMNYLSKEGWEYPEDTYHPVRNKVFDFIYSHPLWQTIMDISSKIDFSQYSSLEKNYVLLVWAESYLMGDQLSQLGIWHAKQRYDLKFECRFYNKIIEQAKPLFEQYHSPQVRQRFFRCPGTLLNHEFAEDRY